MITKAPIAPPGIIKTVSNPYFTGAFINLSNLANFGSASVPFSTMYFFIEKGWKLLLYRRPRAV